MSVTMDTLVQLQTDQARTFNVHNAGLLVAPGELLVALPAGSYGFAVTSVVISALGLGAIRRVDITDGVPAIIFSTVIAPNSVTSHNTELPATVLVCTDDMHVQISGAEPACSVTVSGVIL